MKVIQVEKTASRGIAIAPVFCYRQPNLEPETRSICEEQAQAETERLEQAQAKVIEELGVLAKDLFPSDTAKMDAGAGTIIIEPDSDTEKLYREKSPLTKKNASCF